MPMDITTLGIAVDSRQVKQADKDLNQLTDSAKKNDASLLKLTASMGAVTAALGLFVKSGVALNSQFEQMRLGIASLIAVNSQNVDSMGKSINAAQKFAMAQNAAADAIQLLRKANTETPATLAQLTQGFQATLGPAMALGLSIQQTVKYTTLMTQAAAAMGVPMDQLAQEMRSVLSGTIDANSTVAKNIGLTNEQIKVHIKQGDVYQFLITKLEDFASAGDAVSKSFEGVWSNLMDTADTIKTELTGDLFASATQGLADFNKYLTENRMEIVSSVKEIGKLATSFGAVSLAVSGAYTGYVALNAVQKAYAEYVAASTAALTTYNIATNTATVSTSRLTASQVAATAATRGLALAAANPITATIVFSAVLTAGFEAVKNFIEGDRVQIGGSAAFQKAIEKTKELSTVESQASQVGAHYLKLQDQLNSQLQRRSELAKAGISTKYVDEAIKSTKIEMEGMQKAASELYYGSGGILVAKQKEIELDKKAIVEAKKRAEEQAKIQKGYLDGYAELQAQTAIEAYDTEVYWAHETAQAKLKAMSDAQMAIQKASDDAAETNAENEAKRAIEEYERQTKLWDDIFNNINKAMDANFFNAMTGKFKSFGSWFKDFWSSIMQSVLSGVSRTLADAIMGKESGIQNIFKTFGGLGSMFGAAATPSALIGSTVDFAGFTTTSGGTVFDAAGQITKQGSDYAAVADAINAASTVNTAYSVLTGGLASIGTNIAQGFGYLAEGLNAAGFTTAGAGVSNFGLGAGSVFTGGEFAGMSAMGAGQLLGGAGVGALGGYAVGSLGDKLFGANTKAGTYGAIGGGIGGAIGTAILPGVGTAVGAGIGSALGAIIGGMFGSTKVVESGLYFGQNTSATSGLNNIQNYVDKKSKSWFSSSASSSYSMIDEQTRKSIENIFKSYDYLLSQLGVARKVILKSSRYSAESFKDEIAKNFISQVTGIQQYLNSFLYSRNGFVYTRYRDTPEMTRLFNYWSDYAKSINTTVMEALTTSVGQYISETRKFTEWKLGTGTVEQLKFTSDYLSKDLMALENQMGVTGVTIENYVSRYEQAIKRNFTPETILSWKNLGEALMSATDAEKAYAEALKQSEVAGMQMRDALLAQTVDVPRIMSGIDQNSEEAKRIFIDMKDYLARIYQTQQFGTSLVGVTV